MRPFLHEFLASAYVDYDIVIWSATGMKWIEEKMKLLGVATHQNYKIMFYLDYLAMITVHTAKYGTIDVSIVLFQLTQVYSHTVWAFRPTKVFRFTWCLCTKQNARIYWLILLPGIFLITITPVFSKEVGKAHDMLHLRHMAIFSSFISFFTFVILMNNVASYW